MSAATSLMVPVPVDDQDLPGADFSDEELAELALGSDPDAPLADDAVAFDVYAGEPCGPLPTWYMPPVVARRMVGWRKTVVFGIIAAFLVVDAFGLCMTYGQIVAA